VDEGEIGQTTPEGRGTGRPTTQKETERAPERPDLAFDLTRTYVHLGLGATATELPDFQWDDEALASYERAHAADGDDGRLVVLSDSRRDWTMWECHPAGDELVVVVDGRSTLIQVREGAVVRIPMGPGQAAVNPRGVWHTADVHEPGRTLYVTPGRGTMHRPR
jgi:uncharacterized cupin superfamily protein